MWWDILKNAKLSGGAKSKGTTLSSNRIKIKKPEDCIKRMKDILEPTHTNFFDNKGLDSRTAPIFGMESPEFKKRVYKFIEDAGESTICKILRFIDSYDLEGGLKKYLDMSQDELKKVSEGDGKWQETSIKKEKIDGYDVEINLNAGMNVIRSIDISFNCAIVNSMTSDSLFFNEWATMKLNPNRMSTNNDWRR